MSMDWEEQIRQLNEQQRQVVEQLDQNILLLAAAGTGKTNTLALRIANILRQERAAPEQILCLTFTNRACKEMRERISSMAETAGLTVRTFHGFCFDLIRGYARQSGISEDFLVYDEDDCMELLSELDLSAMQSEQLRPVWMFLQHLKEQRMLHPGCSNGQIVQICHREHPQKLESICSSRGNLNVSQYRFLLRYGGALLKRYDRLLAERHAMDFTDLLEKAEAALDDPDYAEQVASNYRFLHIDEVQDTSLLEYGIIKRIFGNSKLMLCGDYFQTIYQWRGSKPRDIFSDFIANYHPMRVVFDQNYRSTQILLNASYDFLKASFPAQVAQIYGQQMQARAQQEGEPIHFYAAPDVQGEAQWIYQTILEQKPKDLSRVAVLCRNNFHNQKLSEQFARLNLEGDHWIEFLLADRYQFFRSREVRDMLAFLKLTVNRYDDTSLSRVMTHYCRGVGIKTIQKLENKENRQKGIRLHDFVEPDTIDHGDPYHSLTEALEAGRVAVFDVESTGTDTAVDEIIQIAAVRIDREGKVLESFERLLRPGKPVGSSEAVHHFSDRFLAENGEEPSAVLRDFCSFLEGSVVVGHNVGYDLTILSSQLARLGIPQAAYQNDFDTLDLARRFYPDLPNHKLETLSRLLDTQVKSSHDAMDDILATKDVLIHLVREKMIPTLEERREVYQRYAPRFEKLSACLAHLRVHAKNLPLSRLLEEIVECAHMKLLHREEIQQGNMMELISMAKELEQPGQSRWDQIHAFLRVSSLSPSNLDRMLAMRPRAPILTIHQAKGAEFDMVFLAGLQDDTFPSYLSQKSGSLDEERRTFYVAMTRAKKRLYLSCSLRVDGKQKKISRFLKDIPKKYIIVESKNGER